MAAVVAAVALLRFPPERYAFYPRCPFYEAFGFLCPGCGSTRAAAALLHGHLVEALHWNALFVAGLFVVTLYALTTNRREWSRPPSWTAGLGVMAAVVFCVARNR